MARWRIGAATIAGTAVLAATACAPYFASSASLAATPLGQLVRLSWTPAVDDDAGDTVVAYGIEVDGAEVARFPAASGPSCVLTGLAGGTGYTVSVTAYGSNGGEWSGTYGGGLAAMARVSTTYTNGTAGASAGTARTCVAPTDTDGDRLPDAVEDGTGVFVSAAQTGTNPLVADTDNDVLTDGEEVLGTTGGLPLFEMGTRPTKKDVLLETDWMDDAYGCGAHSHRPTSGLVSGMQAAFAGMTTANPDGTTGLNLIVDYGQGGVFTGGNLIPTASLNPAANGFVNADIGSGLWNPLKRANLAPERWGYFHWDPIMHSNLGYPADAEMPGDDLNTPNTGCGAWTDAQFIRLVTHELGHNLGLDHGGDPDNTNGNYYNDKPNYPSVMNYRYQIDGIDTTCDAIPDGVNGFSAGTRPPLDEHSLDEAAGVCGLGNGPAIDWNKANGIDGGRVAADINRTYNGVGFPEGAGDGALTLLTDYDDGAHVTLPGLRTAYPWDDAGQTAPADAGTGPAAEVRSRHVVP